MRENVHQELPKLLPLIEKSTAWLAGKGIENARRETEWLFSAALGFSRLDLYTRFDMLLNEDQVVVLREWVQRRGQREPLAYIIGTQPFCSLELLVNSSVLVPRSETEELVERIITEHSVGEKYTVLDIGTGSGAIALSLKHARPQWQVHATDMSAAAIEVARRNAENAGLACIFHEGHLASHLSQTWDIVVANLPYIAYDEKQLCDPEIEHEPSQALWAEDDGMALIRECIADADRFLEEKGELWLEYGFQQAEAVASCASEHGFICTGFQDMSGNDRFCKIAR